MRADAEAALVGAVDADRQHVAGASEGDAAAVG